MGISEFSIPYTDGQTYTPEEQKQNRQTLCAALKSGKYTHGKGALKNADGTMCCWGVGLDLIDPNGWQAEIDFEGAARFPHRLAIERQDHTVMPNHEVGVSVFGIQDQLLLACTNDANSTTSYAPVIEIIEAL